MVSTLRALVVGRGDRAQPENARSFGAHITSTPTAETLRNITAQGNCAPGQCDIATLTTDARDVIAAAPPDVSGLFNRYNGAADTSIALAGGGVRAPGTGSAETVARNIT